MKEYIAETGGRYTYSDDILNLQALSLSMTAIFGECSAFIISGCFIEGSQITAGYVWLGGKVRYFEGAQNAASPYYIYENNNNESVVYANEVNKRGRCCYQCVGGNVVPDTKDPITNLPPMFVTITQEYAPRLIDKFFGRYALLLDSPSPRQRVNKDVAFGGEVSVEKSLKSAKEIAVQSADNYSLRGRIKENGAVTIGAYLNELLTAEIVIDSDGSFLFLKGATEIAKFTESGFVCNDIYVKRGRLGSICIYQNHIINDIDDTDEGSVNINQWGYNQGITRFRKFNIYDGKRCSVPLLSIDGRNKATTVNGLFKVSGNGAVYILKNSMFAKGDIELTASFQWQDRDGETIASFGFLSTTTNDLSLTNQFGNLIFAPKGYIELNGDVKLKGIDIYSVFTTQKHFTDELIKKVSVIAGKQLSTEDFTTAYKEKLDAISGGTIVGGGEGFVTAEDVSRALREKAAIGNNLNDLSDKAAARSNISVYSKKETDAKYLTISGKLTELVSLTAEEINGMSADQAAARKAEKQADVRAVLDTEKRGTGDLKLTKALNLSDLTDKVQARKNISVYSASEVDKLLDGKLSKDNAYLGVVFTESMKQKLDGIKTGHFAYTDSYGTSQSQVEGYALVSGIVKELSKRAPRLMDGYNSSDKDSVAANLGLYTKTAADGKFAALEKLFQDYITYLVKTGKTTAQAQKMMREQFDVFSKQDITDTYLRKDSRLSDLALPNADAKRLVCRNIGAAYAEDYQTKLSDTGWIQMSNSGSATDTRQLFIRQIGNIVSIQGIISTASKDGSHWGGVIGIIPNQIQPPAYGLRTTIADWDNSTKYNRGSTFVIRGNSRSILIFESGMENTLTEINFTYFV